MEAGFPAASPGDLAAVNAVARAVKNVTVIGLSRSRESDIDAVKEALQGAQDPCIHIFLATSPIHRQHKLRMEKSQVLETAQSAIRYAKKYFPKLEFSLEDAGHTSVISWLKWYPWRSAGRECGEYPRHGRLPESGGIRCHLQILEGYGAGYRAGTA